MAVMMSLWLPILLSAVAVFIVSSLLHMVLPYHRNDFRKLPDEPAVADALRPLNIPPGDYALPAPGEGERFHDPAVVERMKAGPVLMMTVMKSGPANMGPSLIMWFIYAIIVSKFAAYVAGNLIAPGAEYLHVHRWVGTVAFAGYGLALLQNSIWYKRNWAATLKSVFDALIYALVTGGVFGWLWPAA